MSCPICNFDLYQDQKRLNTFRCAQHQFSHYEIEYNNMDGYNMDKKYERIIHNLGIVYINYDDNITTIQKLNGEVGNVFIITNTITAHDAWQIVKDQQILNAYCEASRQNITSGQSS